ncbi:Gfo/Idh/MocA family protein [Kribbella aluminosa]|uniref:Gfo/Idh/MocA family protein n=1 Tax=Kribbella aluminosa TaxID=416017 RepID=UPI001AE318BE|nr:Gfo/Idh/MocA family oxidoreductase [Kribbella aluminosa]
MADCVRIGVVGAGSISVRGLLPHLSQGDLAGRVELAAVCDPVVGRAEAAAGRFGVGRAFVEYEELLAHGDVDAVTIASPIGLHYEQGKLALQAGKHVHFNKTMTLSVAEATELIELAEDRDLRIVASPGEMLRPHHVRTRELIADGAIGTLSWVSCGAAFGTYHEDESVRGGSDVLTNIDPSWYFRKPGGGPVYDMTVYALHSVTGILGPAKRVTAMSGVRVPVRNNVQTDADDNTVMLIDFGDNLFCVATGTAAGGMRGGFGGAYYGTAGTIDGLLLNDEPFDFPHRDPAELSPRGPGNQALLPHVTGVHREIEEQHVYEDVMQLVDWVRDGKPSIVTAEHARHVIDIIESAYRASATGRTQDLTTTF